MPNKTLNYTVSIALALASFAFSVSLASAREAKPSGLEQKVEKESVQSVEPNDVNDVNEVKIKYTSQELKELQNILYGEAANQPRTGRKVITRLILNRVKNKDYSKTIHGVLYEKNAFSCINDKKNKNWQQATGKSKRNEYEEMIYRRCEEDAKIILEGGKLNISRENEIIAFHDTSIKYEDLVAKELALKEKYKKQGKIYKGYWMNLEPVYKISRLIFYAPKKELKASKN